MMTRKDFQLLATIIKEMDLVGAGLPASAGEIVAERIAAGLHRAKEQESWRQYARHQARYPNDYWHRPIAYRGIAAFNRDKFLDACRPGEGEE